MLGFRDKALVLRGLGFRVSGVGCTSDLLSFRFWAPGMYAC